jgi:Cu-Zn family superoxide dismutase
MIKTAAAPAPVLRRRSQNRIHTKESNMKAIYRVIAGLVGAALVVGAGLTTLPAQAQATNGATAAIKDAQGTVVGTATLTEGAGGVKLQVQVRGFTAAAAGEHGIHIHAVGTCEAPGFTTAGGHFNPAAKKHGLNSAEGAHGGDLPNLVVNAGGDGTYEAMNDRITLAAGATNSLFDADGSAVVIHAGPDDYVTDPAGNSGARIACGVLQAAQIPSGMPRTGAPGAPAGLWLALLGGGALALGWWVARRPARA